MADGGDQRLVGDELGCDPRGRRAGEANQREVEFAGLDRLEQTVGVCLGERDLYRGVFVVEGGQQVWQLRERGQRDHPHGDVSAQQSTELVDSQSCAGGCDDRGAGVWNDRGADLSEAHSAPGTIEQVLSELALEPANLRAHARLGDVRLGGSRGEAPLLRHRDEVLELPQLHNE